MIAKMLFVVPLFLIIPSCAKRKFNASASTSALTTCGLPNGTVVESEHETWFKETTADENLLPPNKKSLIVAGTRFLVTDRPEDCSGRPEICISMVSAEGLHCKVKSLVPSAFSQTDGYIFMEDLREVLPPSTRHDEGELKKLAASIGTYMPAQGVDNCFARALFITMELIANNIPSEIVTLTSCRKETPLSMNGLKWTYHTAPVVMADGREWVLDILHPNQVVAFDSWKASMNVPHFNEFRSATPRIPFTANTFEYKTYLDESPVTPCGVFTRLDRKPSGAEIKSGDTKYLLSDLQQFCGALLFDALSFPEKKVLFKKRAIELISIMREKGLVKEDTPIAPENMCPEPFGG